MRFEIQTLGAFLKDLHQDFFVKGMDAQGPYYTAIEDALQKGPVSGSNWQEIMLKIVWNDAGTIAVTAIANSTKPDRSCRVFFHKSEVFGK